MKLELEVEGDFTNIRANVIRALETDVYPYFRQFAKEIVNENVAKRPGQPYAISVDSKLVNSIEGIGLAKKEVQVVWIREAVKLAVREYANILKGSAWKHVANWRTELQSEIPREVRVFYGGRDKATREISSANDIKEFTGDDFIMITTSSPWQTYLNTKGKAKKSHRVHPLKKDVVGHKGGYFGLAARRVKTLLGARRKAGSAIWVGAVRSQAVLQEIGRPDLKTTAGRLNWLRLQEWGAWAILIKLSVKPANIGAVQRG